ncbi:MAG: HNH endonuclease [Planctomycetota bacterium]
MPVKKNRRATVKRVIQERGLRGCEMCGSSKPNLANLGLHVCHVVSASEGGEDNPATNLLALCPSCADAFDLVLKPKIHRALMARRGPATGKVPDNWSNAEGRQAKGDLV